MSLNNVPEFSKFSFLLRVPRRTENSGQFWKVLVGGHPGQSHTTLCCCNLAALLHSPCTAAVKEKKKTIKTHSLLRLHTTARYADSSFTHCSRACTPPASQKQRDNRVAVHSACRATIRVFPAAHTDKNTRLNTNAEQLQLLNQIKTK